MKTINFKTATVEELKILPQIGNVRAKAIQEIMKDVENRPKDIYELSNIVGLGTKRMKTIISFIEKNNINLKF